MAQERRRWFSLGRIVDVLAVLVIVFVAWKIFIAPRSLKNADAYPAPHVAYARLDGTGTFRLADARGRVVFLDFFASWCTPCRMEMPLVERYARAHPEVEVVPIDVGEPRSLAATFSQQFHVRNVALDPTASASGFFQLQGFPTLVVIDPQGRIRASWVGFNPAVELAMSHAERALN